MADYTDLTDDELAALQRDVNREVERRQMIAALPVQIEGLSRAYLAAGGDVADITSAVAASQEAEQVTETPVAEESPVVEVEEQTSHE